MNQTTTISNGVYDSTSFNMLHDWCHSYPPGRLIIENAINQITAQFTMKLEEEEEEEESYQ